MISIDYGRANTPFLFLTLSLLLSLSYTRNPAVEDQAIDRVHRLGQTREVSVKRYVVADTVEERLVRVQEKKREVADGALNMSDNERRQMRLDEVVYLFS